MITCPICQSIDVRVNDGNFTEVKLEGQPAAVHTHDKYFYFCEKCNYQWESTPESQQDYYDYMNLRSRTEMFAQDMQADGSYGPAHHLDLGDLSRRIELSKKIFLSYKHLLNLEAGLWFEIEKDSKREF